MRVISVDPGIISGYCYAELENGELLYRPFQATDDVDDVFRRLDGFQPRYIVCEDFEFRRGRGGVEFFPVQIIGAVRLYSMMSRSQCACFMQPAATGKSYYNDATLKKLRLYERGIPHGMDASRHLLHWCMFGYGNQYIGSKKTEEFAQIGERSEWWRK
jgi:hypothetical protein